MLTLSKRTVSLLLIAALLVTLFPVLGTPSQAASTAYGLHLNAPFSGDENVNPDEISLSPGNPYETNESSVSISGTVEQIDAHTISYRVIRYGTTQMRDEQISPTVSDRTFSFANILLFPGLNEIELYYETGTGSVSQEKRYVYFHNAPSISGLEVIAVPNVKVEDFSLPTYDENDFPNYRNIFNRVIKLDRGPYDMNSPVIFQGNASNADEVLLGTQPAGIYGNRFIVDTGQMGVVKGDYTLNFLVRNALASVNTPINVAFSNGEPVVLDIHANMDGDTDIRLDQLNETYLTGTFDGDSTNFTFSGYLYIEQGINFSRLDVNLQHVADAITTQASVSLEQSALDAMPNFTDTSGAQNYTVYYLENVELTSDPVDPADPTTVFDITKAPGQYRLTFETFNTENPPVRHFSSQTYPIRYVNENLPFIQNVTQNGMPLATNPVISRIGQDIIVEVGGSTKKVKLSSTMLSSSYDPASVAEKNVGTDKRVSFTLDNLRPGVQTFYITASDDDNSSTEEFVVEAVLTPTVKLIGLSDGHSFNTNSIEPLIAEYVNLTNETERAKTQIFLNGGPLDQSDTTAYYTITDVDNLTNACADCLKENQFGIHLNSSAIVPGKNELRFRFTNNAVVSERVFVFYYLAADSPMIEATPMDDDQNTDKFERADSDNFYTTTEGEVFFSGTIANGSTFVLRQNGDIISEYTFDTSTGWTIKNTNHHRVTFNSGSGGSYTFRTEPINLILENDDGTLNYSADNTFSFEAYKYAIDTAPVNISEIIIRRNPAAYEMTPETKNFFDKGIINRNYVPFTIDTDGATKVLVNKLEMKQIKHDVANSKRVRYHLDVPLTIGKSNKLDIEITYPGLVVKDTLHIDSAAINQPGAAYVDVFGDRPDFKKLFNGDLELSFNRGTRLRQAHPFTGGTGALPQLYTNVPIFFGIAVPDSGLVLEENRDELGPIHHMRTQLLTPTQYARASDLYWIDAGLVEDGSSLERPGAATGGSAPFTQNNGTFANFRHFSPRMLIEPTQPGTLTLKYDESLVTAATPLLTVMHHDGERWHNLGGVVNSRRGTITVPFERFGYYTVMRLDRFFVDANQHDWARDDINILKARGWMRELTPSLFGTGTFAQRGELATMLVKMLDIQLDYAPQRPGSRELTFPDVPEHSADEYNRWDYRHIETAARKGIVIGRSDNYFRPADTITRQDAAVMIARAMELKLATNESAERNMNRKFLDGQAINFYAYASIEAVEKKGIMQGRPGPVDKTFNFAPLANLTRAELATIAVRVLRDMKRLE